MQELYNSIFIKKGHLSTRRGLELTNEVVLKLPATLMLIHKQERAIIESTLGSQIASGA